MKPIYALPPAAALIAFGLWLASQRQTISSLERQTAQLRNHLQAEGSRPSGDGGRGAAHASIPQRGTGRIAWKDLAELIAKGERGSVTDMQAAMEIREKISALTGPEIAAAFDEMVALELGSDARRSLDFMLLDLLVQKDPQLALDHCIDLIGNPYGVGTSVLERAFRQRLAEDRAAGLAWFDAQIAAGKFERRSLDGAMPSRVVFEAALVESLVGTDPAAAAKRLAMLPEVQRRLVLDDFRGDHQSPGVSKAFATLVREQVSESARVNVLTSQVGGMCEGSSTFEKVSGFLAEIEASPDERAGIAKQAARFRLQELAQQGGINRQAIDELRGWVALQSPDQVDAITGKALADAFIGKSTWDDRSRLVEQLHAENPEDDLLVSFLGGDEVRSHRDAALAMAFKIADEAKRAEIVARIQGGPLGTSIVAE